MVRSPRQFPRQKQNQAQRSAEAVTVKQVAKMLKAIHAKENKKALREKAKVVGCFPDGNSALMLVCARLRHVAGTQWGNKNYMSMKHLETLSDDASLAG